MKIKSIVLATAVLGGLLSASSFASVVPTVNPATFSEKFQAPAPAKVVHPTGLLREHIGAVVTLSLTIDAAGQPHDIKIVSPVDRNLKKQLLPVLSQWKFTPALQNGTPVSTKVLLPVQLLEGPVS